MELPPLLAALAAHRTEAPQRALLVELAGGLLVPFALAPQPVTQADLLARADVEVVVVARAGLGTLNHTQLTCEALRRRGLEPRALLLVGEPFADNAIALRRLTGLPRVVEVPHFATLTPEVLAAFAASNDLASVWP